VIDPEMEGRMKVTVLATGFDSGGWSAGERPRVELPQVAVPRTTLAVPPPLAAKAEETAAPEPVERPFYRKVFAYTQDDDPNGFGPNWSNVDDYDIPTVLRKQMD
jgi:glycine/D-amino acid oxidase-like deaminating enzyme